MTTACSLIGAFLRRRYLVEALPSLWTLRIMAKKTATMLQVIENLSTGSLVPHASNSRLHGDEQIESIIKSIQEFGFCNPVLIDAKGGIIAGHGRVLAAAKMKMKTVPCLRLLHLNPTQRKAYVIADNKIAMGSTWDEDQLASVLHELNDASFDMGSLGFVGDELVDILNGIGDAPPDEFKVVDEFIATEHRCPKCHYAWSGKSA